MYTRAYAQQTRLTQSLPDVHKPEVQNARAIVVLKRVKDKLTGHDFRPTEELTVPDQVEKLIQQATSLEVCYSFQNAAKI